MAQQTILSSDTVYDALITKVNNNDDDAYASKAEVEAARDGLSTLLAKIETIDAAVAVLSAEGGLLCSATDTAVADYWTKILPAIGGNIVANTSDDTLVAADLIGLVRTLNNGGGSETVSLGYGEKIFTNTGAAGAVNLTLPAGATGQSFTIIVTVAQYLKTTANGTETFRFGANTSAAGGYLRSNVVGTAWRCVWNGASWTFIAIAGAVSVDE